MVLRDLKKKKYSGTIFSKLFESQFIMKVVIILCQVLLQGLEGLKEKKVLWDCFLKTFRKLVYNESYYHSMSSSLSRS